MKSIREIYKIGKGPSSSHTMGPERAAGLFKKEHPDADAFEVILYGSLSKTGIGHGTDRVIREVLAPMPAKINFSKEDLPGSHPNTMDFFALKDGKKIGSLRVESIGGGDIRAPARAFWTHRRCIRKTPLQRSRISASGAISTSSAIM